MEGFDRTLFEQGYASRFSRFQDLMRNRVHNILLVSSHYDSFILEEDGRFDERLIMEYAELNLVHMPRITRASSGSEAIRMATAEEFDLIIATMHLGDMHAVAFSRTARKIGIGAPIVLLTYDYRELKDLQRSHGTGDFEKVFLWQGDYRILLAIVKLIEDRLNVKPDSRLVGVQSIIVIEDNVRFYSSYLPIIYAELVRHTQSVLSEAVNFAHRVLRMRARPKIILCENYEEAWEFFEKYHETVLGVISDVEFPKDGRKDSEAGAKFARNVREVHPDIPILLQSGSPNVRKLARKLNVQCLQKHSPRLLNKLQQFLVEHLSFGDFVFRLPDNKEVARADNLQSLERAIAEVPEESLLYHAERNHFSNWLKARTEFRLAYRLRPRKISDYDSGEALRADLIRRLREFRTDQSRGIIMDFDRDTFDPESSFARSGGGSLGGKGRGLAFFSTLIDTHELAERYEGIHLSVPPAVVIGTGVFDLFMEKNNLLELAMNTDDDRAIERAFIAAKMPRAVTDDLRRLLDLMKYPLAVRSSSLLEDSQHQPFAGVYRTCMLPNVDRKKSKRLEQLLNAIKLVYASTYSHSARTYIKATPYRLEEEKMAVIVQKLVGIQHNERFYPDFAGVARSHNFYPIPPMEGPDGIVSVALGLGSMVVEGGASMRFCPSYPKHVVQFSSVEDTLRFSQKEFYALDMTNGEKSCRVEHEPSLSRFDLTVAEEDGTLNLLASTYSPENDAIYDGISRTGPRVISFAPILKGGAFPLTEVLQELLSMGRQSMSGAVELEFAVNLSVPEDRPKQFRVVQMRPMVVNAEWDHVVTSGFDERNILCESGQVLGNGIATDIHHVVMVDYDKFDRSVTSLVAQEIGRLNHELYSEDIPYILIGLGRWGSNDPWLGIPVKWDQIAGARVIVEAGFKDMQVTPSQGTHFFQNLASLEIGYFTVPTGASDGFVDWAWLSGQRAESAGEYCRLLKFEQPITVKMDGRKSHGIILKPGAEETRNSTT